MDADLLTWQAFSAAFEKRRPPRRTLADLARTLHPKTIQTPALDLIDAALVEAFDTPDARVIISMPPQEGKSTRVNTFVTWALLANPDARVVTASYGQSLANRNGLAIRRSITDHPELGLEIADDNGAKHDWSLAGRDGGLLSVGVGAGLTGRPAELMVIDDPIKDRKQADSETYRQAVWDWWTDSASTRLAPGAPVVLVLTRWHQDDLAGRLLAAPDGHLWRVINIPAEADHDPAKGGKDPLGREPGEFMQSARRRSRKQWEAIRTRVGSRTWASLYQGRPSPAAGDVFLRDGWSRYEHAPWVERDDGSRVIPLRPRADVEIIQSWDCAFKDTTTSDFVVGQVWMRDGVDAFLLDQVRGRLSFVATCQAIRDMTARWPQAALKLVEDKANGPAVLNALRRKVGGLVPVEPEGSKYARAVAVTPFVEARNVHLPSVELAPWVAGLIEECAGFPNAANDDQVDALSQAVHRLLLVPILNRDIRDAEDLLDEHEEHGLSWSVNY